MSIEFPPDLVYLTDESLGIRREKSGRGFSYLHPSGNIIRDPNELERIETLVIPPAWEEVWIAPIQNAHLQATGRDEKQRKQYRYHDLWTKFAQKQKFNHLLEFGELLPKIRQTCKIDLKREEWDFKKVAALAVTVMDSLHLRIGNKFYSKTNHTYGLTTLRRKHLNLDEEALELSFIGKTGRERTLKLEDKKLIQMVKRCSDLPGYEIFRYRENSEMKPLLSEDFNNYLRAIAEDDAVSAKDFRTWGANVLCIEKAMEAKEKSKKSRKKLENILVSMVAKEMGHTVATCKKSYIHPEVLKHVTCGKKIYTDQEQSPYDAAEKKLIQILKGP
jgi:DNA topoisomerase-1